MKIIHFPLTKIILFFVFGILFSFYKNPNPETVFTITFISFVVFLISFLLSKRDFNQKIYFGVSLYIVSFFIGITTQTVHNDYFQKENYIHQIQDFEKEHIVELVLREKLKNSTFSNRYVAVVKKIDSKESSGKIIINFYTIKLTEKLAIGTQLRIKGSVVKHKTVNNPDQFDYGKYLINKSILAQMYVSPEDILVGTSVDKDIWYYSDKIRSKILDNLQQSGFKNDELNVVAALILGQQQEISTEILTDYQYAGAIHILSVSGLHVGFILLFINFLLKQIRFLHKTHHHTTSFMGICNTCWYVSISSSLGDNVLLCRCRHLLKKKNKHLLHAFNIFIFHLTLSTVIFI